MKRLVFLGAIVTTLLFTSCSSDNDQVEKDLIETLIGKWNLVDYQINNETAPGWDDFTCGSHYMEFYNDTDFATIGYRLSDCEPELEHGNYFYNKNTLKLIYEDDRAFEGTCTIQGNRLTFTYELELFEQPPKITMVFEKDR